MTDKLNIWPLVLPWNKNKNKCSIATTGPPICELSTSTTTTCGLWGFQWEVLATTPSLYHVTKKRNTTTTTTTTATTTSTTATIQGHQGYLGEGLTKKTKSLSSTNNFLIAGLDLGPSPQPFTCHDLCY